MKKIISRTVVLALCLIVLSVAIDALAAPPSKTPPRFVDNLDGTITDTKTGLMWEKKTGSVGAPFVCSDLTPCADPSNVNYQYTWSATLSAADGTLFADFLARMNCSISSSAIPTSCGAGPYSDWRIPTLAELRTILTTEYSSCSAGPPCIDPIFGPTATAVSYWSSTTDANPSGSGYAWSVGFFSGSTPNAIKTDAGFARAVRGGR